jgi:hypothetical protein
MPRVASPKGRAFVRPWPEDKAIAINLSEINRVEINDEAKQIIQELGAAINMAVGNSKEVADAIARLRQAGYEMELTLRLEIGLRHHEENESRDMGVDSDAETGFLELTDEDRRTLRRMKIRLDDDD